MRLKRSAVALATASLLALAACGGGGDDDSGGECAEGSVDTENLGNTGERHRPGPRGPRHDRGRHGGRHRHGADRARAHHAARPLGPLLHRHQRDHDRAGDPVADPVRLRRGVGPDDPGPRPRDRPRHAQRGLHRVEVHAARRRQVGDRRAGHRRGGRLRHRPSMDGKTFPNGPGLSYSNAYFLGGEDYKGPYTDPGGSTPSRRSPSTATPSPSRWPSRSRTSPTTRRSRPSARSRPTRPSATRRSTPSSPLVDRPVQDRAVHRRQVADPGPQRPVGPGHRPGAHGVPGQLRVQGGPVGRADRPDPAQRLRCGARPRSPTTTCSPRTTGSSTTPVASVTGGQPCTFCYCARPAQGDGQGHRRGADLGQSPTRTRSSPPG